MDYKYAIYGITSTSTRYQLIEEFDNEESAQNRIRELTGSVRLNNNEQVNDLQLYNDITLRKRNVIYINEPNNLKFPLYEDQIRSILLID